MEHQAVAIDPRSEAGGQEAEGAEPRVHVAGQAHLHERTAGRHALHRELVADVDGQPEEEERTQACLKRRAASRPPGRHATAAAATAAESGGGDRHEEAEAELLNMVGGRNGPEPRLEGRVRLARAGEPASGPVHERH